MTHQMDTLFIIMVMHLSVCFPLLLSHHMKEYDMSLAIISSCDIMASRRTRIRLSY